MLTGLSPSLKYDASRHNNNRYSKGTNEMEENNQYEINTVLFYCVLNIKNHGAQGAGEDDCGHFCAVGHPILTLRPTPKIN